mmetsp:Transcript_37421/g.76168  ORF Transcript_37421/g.76168 Transcript_37421/m.76168 type:complete len:93 (+) Transcript_37421:207-485(+)
MWCLPFARRLALRGRGRRTERTTLHPPQHAAAIDLISRYEPRRLALLTPRLPTSAYVVSIIDQQGEVSSFALFLWRELSPDHKMLEYASMQK